MTKVQPENVKSEEKRAVSASKKDIKPTLVSKAPEAPFKMNEWHTKALLKLLACHHSNGQTLTYAELSREIGVGEKTKAWQCVAWKDLKTHEFIIKADNNKLKLSEKGVGFATSIASPEDLADYKMPETNEEHHEKIKSRLIKLPKAKKYGPKIFDFLVTMESPMHGNAIAAHFDVDADSHGFFYGLQALKKMGLVRFAKVPREKAKKREDNEDNTAAYKDKNGREIEEGEIVEDEEEEQTGKKKKKTSKAKKNKTGGKPLELTEAAFLATVGKN